MLTVTNCSVTIPPNNNILSDITFSVMAPSISKSTSNFITSIIGKSGSGKSTLLRCIAGLQHYSGTITINDKNQHTIPVHQRNIGWVDQSSTLLPHLTIEQNIGLPLTLRKHKKASIGTTVASLMQEFGIDHLRLSKPHEISGGEQQRTAIARALIYSPSLLLLDEPFGALDAITRYELTQWLQPVLQYKRITTLLVTHDIREAKQLSSKAIVLEDGSIIADDTWSALATHEHPTVQRLLQLVTK